MKLKNKLLILMFLVYIPLFCITEAIPPANYNDQDAGSIINPYLISNLANLRWVSETQEVWGDENQKFYFLQTGNIDASETENWNEGKGFNPIGVRIRDSEGDQDITIIFYGNYNGDNFEISNLYINFSDDTNIKKAPALFASVKNSEIINVNLLNVRISGKMAVAPLVGVAENSIIENCSASGIIHFYAEAGPSGGLISALMDSEIKYSFASTDIVVHNIESPYVKSIGGIAGLIYNSSINNSFFSGSIDCDITPDPGGGLVGDMMNSEIEYAYVTSSAIFNNAVGIVGVAVNSSFVNCFWDIETTGTLQAFSEIYNSVSDVYGATTLEMKSSSLYVSSGWDFDSIWSIEPEINNGYPFLNSNIVSEAENTIHNVYSNFVYPNPVNGGEVNFKTTLNTSQMEISIYNVKGQLVKRSKDFQSKDGDMTFSWNKKNEQNQSVASGVYFYKIKTDKAVQTGKFLIIK